jgi:mono/diheme cytochrome c family protein
MRFRLIAGMLAMVIGFFGSSAPAADRPSPERGRDLLFYHSLNPANWSMQAYDDAWKQWGVREKPSDYDAVFRQRYGLHWAPFENKGKPLGLIEAPRFFGKGLTNNCLLCHAGTIAGQTIIGLGNASLDLQGLFEDLSRADGLELGLPFQMAYVRGTIDPLNPVAFLLQFRDADLNVQKPHPFHYSAYVCSDPPAWWLLKKKKTRDWTAPMDVHSTRIDMVNLLTPLNSGGYIQKQEAAFADLEAYLRTIEAPKYPFPIDEPLAARGRELYQETCARCHGTYGPAGHYPNKIVALGTIGTDRTLADGTNPEVLKFLNQSWFGREPGPGGQPLQFTAPSGYQAPPLDGIWATAPYFHNGSVPTVYHVLKSKARPKVYTRSYRTGPEDYDPVKLGCKMTVLDSPVHPKSGFQARQIYDTTQPGRGNGGHTFGDHFSDEQRAAVIEYLKTL